MTICCSGERSALFLNSKSPMALDKARLPLTRPNSTKPPAALIRAFSPVQLRCQLCLLKTAFRGADLHSAVYDQKRAVLRDPSLRALSASHPRWPTAPLKSSGRQRGTCVGILNSPPISFFETLLQPRLCIQKLLLVLRI